MSTAQTEHKPSDETTQTEPRLFLTGGKQKNLYFISFYWCDTAVLCCRRENSEAVSCAGPTATCIEKPEPEGTIRGVTAGHGRLWLPPCLSSHIPESTVRTRSWHVPVHAPHNLQNHFITITISVHLSLVSYCIISLCNWHLEMTWHKNSIRSIFTSSEHRLEAENTFPTRKQKDENEAQKCVPSGSWLYIYALF